MVCGLDDLFAEIISSWVKDILVEDVENIVSDVNNNVQFGNARRL